VFDLLKYCTRLVRRVSNWVTALGNIDFDSVQNTFRVEGSLIGINDKWLLLQLQSKHFNPHCTLGLLAKYNISQLFAINKLHKNCLNSLMKLILQGFYPNSTQNATFND